MGREKSGASSCTTQQDNNSANAAQQVEKVEADEAVADGSPAVTQEDATEAAAGTPPVTQGEVKEEEEEEEEEDVSTEPKGDPEMAPVYLRKLLPIFTQVYQSTMLPSVRYLTPSTIQVYRDNL